MLNSLTDEDASRSSALISENETNVGGPFDNSTHNQFNENENKHDLMRQVTYVYDNKKPYVCIVPIYPDSNVLHLNITSLTHLERMANQTNDMNSNNH